MKAPLLVNPGHPLAEGFEPSSLSPALPGSDILLESECAAALTALVEQLALWEETLRAQGEEFTRKYVAIPGCSEHETGLAIDLALDTGGEIDFIRPYFPYDGVCGEFRAKAAEYGFIERYPAGKERITRISAEPWHFRYVGREHAVRIAAGNLALEEYAEIISGGSHEQTQP